MEQTTARPLDVGQSDLFELDDQDGPVVVNWSRPSWATRSIMDDGRGCIDHDHHGTVVTACNGDYVWQPVLNVSDHFRLTPDGVAIARGPVMVDLHLGGAVEADERTAMMTVPEFRELVESLTAVLALADAEELHP